jgi:hypothetical protein
MFSRDTAQEIKGYLRGGLPSNLRSTSIVEKAGNKPSLKPLHTQAFLRSVVNRSGWAARMDPPEAGGIHAGNPNFRSKEHFDSASRFHRFGIEKCTTNIHIENRLKR